ncbi:SDR family NAD(P)-dependent oxidoreductase [Rathayibacter rathayi]|uniref:SDR family NAD(P)-dependent oxidoreductase n=1 Tax=Rathayibacter rathayi TaxID=33887 RepID=UPI000CE8F163|nr:SDR family NAD(P)-dependent oxidoreductase [Rathayibacter rathayi]PPF23459.1 hypothetical protein C5C34_08415 [Rathayibacter rathayi]PPG94500.1 hypothetical protein C5C22_08450 [Rathayibacter rathayi]
MTATKRVAFVTGASGGLGGGMCRALLAEGWTVFAHVRTEGEGRDLVAWGARVIAADLTFRTQVSHLVEQVESETNRLDIMVNNAAGGYGPPNSERQTTIDGWESRLAVNALAPLALLRGLGDRLGPGSRVVNVASTNQGLVDIFDLQLTSNWSRQNSYRQSKALLLIITDVFARRWKSRGITVNAVHPGTRLPTKIVLESGVEPLGSLRRGLDACLSEVRAVNQETAMFVRAAEKSIRITDLYPDTSTSDALVTRLERMCG